MSAAERFPGLPTPWKVIPAIPGSPAFIRAADDKTVARDLRSDDVAERIVYAVNLLALLEDIAAIAAAIDLTGEADGEDLDLLHAALVRLDAARKIGGGA